MAWEVLGDGIQSKMVKIAKMVKVANIVKIVRKAIASVMVVGAYIA